MNRNRRKQLAEVNSMLSRAVSIVESVCEDEQDCLDNMPENLQFSDRYSDMEDAISNMEDAIESINSAIESVDKASQ